MVVCPPSQVTTVIPPLNNDDHVCGSLDAALVLMNYGDYQCPRSAQANRTIRDLQQFTQTGTQPESSNNLCVVFRHFPCTQIHPQAQKAAETAEAAAAQGKFWEMHDILFKHHRTLEDGNLVEYAAQLNLDMPRFLQELSAHVYAQRVQADIASGQSYGVKDTPTFFIAIRHQDCQKLEQILMALLEAVSAKRNF